MKITRVEVLKTAVTVQSQERIVNVTTTREERKINVSISKAILGIPGKSGFELWKELPGNSEKTLNDYFAFLATYNPSVDGGIIN